MKKFLTLALLLPTLAFAQSNTEAIRKALSARLPHMPAISEVRATPFQGLYEIHSGDDIFYSDAQGRFVVQGQLIDLQAQRNLTQERLDQLSAVDYKALPFDDAFVIKRGKGERQLAVFADPYCGYCKRLERDLAGIDNITIHVFLYPVLGPQSTEQSQAIWCVKPAQRGQAWMDWMLKGTAPSAKGDCDTKALTRNLAFGRKHRIEGTPTLFFADGTRAPGALSAAQIEAQFAAIH
jgi:thiol:disulfide interchange protein DsbC